MRFQRTAASLVSFSDEERVADRGIRRSASNPLGIERRAVKHDYGNKQYVGHGKTERMQIGSNSTEWFRKDPRAMAYTASKYLTVAKLLLGQRKVLEIGCGDGFGLPIVAQHVKELMALELNTALAFEARSYAGDRCGVMFGDWLDPNMIEVPGAYSAIYCLDVLEHIDPMRERDFLLRVVAHLGNDGVFICGMPTLNSQEYATDYGKQGHINCQTPGQIVATLKDHFAHVFDFGLTDGHINVGYWPMRQYQLNLCTGPRT